MLELDLPPVDWQRKNRRCLAPTELYLHQRHVQSDMWPRCNATDDHVPLVEDWGLPLPSSVHQ